jgi:hypothetical protein
VADAIPPHIDSPRATSFDSPRLAHKAQLAAALRLTPEADGGGGRPGSPLGPADGADGGGDSPRGVRLARAVTPLGRPHTPVAASPLAREGGGKGAEGEESAW